jgi:hypothetical protein
MSAKVDDDNCFGLVMVFPVPEMIAIRGVFRDQGANRSFTVRFRVILLASDK